VLEGRATLAIVIALFAFKAAKDSEVHQVHAQFGFAGLVAALFEDHTEKRIVGNEKDLFHENDLGGKSLIEVGVHRSALELFNG
jgi:hypothetical protein